MKKVITTLIMFALIIIPFNVYADGGVSVSSSSISITEGGTSSFKITAKNAAGKVTISSNDSSISSINKGSVWLDNSSETITVKGLKQGTTTIIVKMTDVATYSGDVVNGEKRITVKVKEKTTTTADTRSSDNDLKSISVEGYELEKIDNNHYSLTVSNSVTSINVSAEADSNKASIEGTGARNIEIGENDIEVIIIAENQNKNRIHINVTRKDGYYITDIDEALKNDGNIDIILDDEQITKDLISKIIESKKTVSLNKYNDDKKLIYSWIIDGTKNISAEDFDSLIEFLEDYDEIKDKANYVEGIYFGYKEKTNIPEGISLKIYVGDSYKDGDLVNIYSYDGKSFNLENKEIKVQNGFIEYEIKTLKNSILTRASINGKAKSVTNNEFNLYAIIAIAEFVFILALLFLLVLKKKNKKTTKKKSKN